MPVLDQQNVNLGTRENPNYVMHDLHDKRITTTAITTCSHILASSSAGLTSIAPITAANLASVLGGQMINIKATVNDDANNFPVGTAYVLTGGLNVANKPAGMNDRMVIYTYGQKGSESSSAFQIAMSNGNMYATRDKSSNAWNAWTVFPSFYKDYSDLSSLATAVGVNSYTDGSLDNLNTFITNNHRIVAKNATGCPVANQFGYVICIRFGSYAMQLYWPFSGNGIYLRTASISGGGDFTNSPWYLISATAV